MVLMVELIDNDGFDMIGYRQLNWEGYTGDDLNLELYW